VARVDEIREESQCPPVVRRGTDQIGRQMHPVTSTKQREGLVSLGGHRTVSSLAR
jgi:hypothetical protein